MTPMVRRAGQRAAAASMLALAAGAAGAQSAALLQTRSLAATCAGCHGSEGKAIAGEAMPRLSGLKKDYFVAQMLAFRDGSRPATVMHQISKGYSSEQIEALASYFGAGK